MAASAVQQTTQICQTLSPPRQRRRQHHDSEMRPLLENDNHAVRVISPSQTALRSCVSHVAAVRPPSARGWPPTSYLILALLAFLTFTVPPIASSRPTFVAERASRALGWPQALTAHLRPTPALISSLRRSSDASQWRMQKQGQCLVSVCLTALSALSGIDQSISPHNGTTARWRASGDGG